MNQPQADNTEIETILQVYFPNAKEAEFQYVTVPNLLLSIKPYGKILYMLRFVRECNVQGVQGVPKKRGLRFRANLEAFNGFKSKSGR